jgi:hypothetical protein
MPISKSTATVEAPKADVAQTAPAPVSRKLDTGTPAVENKKTYQGRDFDAEARCKVACVAFNAALASPGIAGLPFANFDEYIALVRKAADASVAYTWEKQK